MFLRNRAGDGGRSPPTVGRSPPTVGRSPPTALYNFGHKRYAHLSAEGRTAFSAFQFKRGIGGRDESGGSSEQSRQARLRLRGGTQEDPVGARGAAYGRAAARRRAYPRGHGVR